MSIMAHQILPLDARRTDRDNCKIFIKIQEKSFSKFIELIEILRRIKYVMEY